MDPNPLIAALVTLVVFILGLFLKLTWDNKRDLKEQKTCINEKRDKAECDRLMDKLEDREGK